MVKKKILCATDFSVPSILMSDAAAAIALKLGTQLILVHVLEPSAVAGDVLSESLEAAAKARLHTEAARLRMSGCEVEEVLLEGSTYEAITDFAERLPAGLVVMASHQKRELPKRWFFGGVVERVVKTSSVPTLILRDATRLNDWISGSKPLRIFVAADLSSSLDAPLLWAKDLTRIGPCEITVAYLNWIPDETIRLGLAATSSMFEGSYQLQTLLEKELRDKATRLVGDLPVQIKVEPRWGRADLPLIGMAELAHTDLFVVGNRRKTGGLFSLFGESVSLGVLHEAPMSVAVVPLVESVVDAPLPVFKRVLVPTDFSDLANHAIPYACSIVSPGGTVYVAHVASKNTLSVSDTSLQLDALVPSYAAERGIHFETILWHGESEPESIGQLAVRLGADVICIGSHGRSGISRAVLGSVAQEVLANSRCPVLVVRKPI